MTTASSHLLLTSPDHQQLTSQANIDSQIHNLVQKIHGRIESVNKQIERIVSKNESEFAYAYRSHLTKIKKQLAEISKKSEQQEKMFSADDRIKFLEKQVAVFREQALKIYQKLEDATEEANKYKHKYEDLFQAYKNNQNVSKQSLKHAKHAQAVKMGLESKIKQLQQKLQQKNSEIVQIQSEGAKRSYRNEKYKLNSLALQRSGSTCQNMFRTSTRLKQSVYKLSQDEYCQYFCECMKRVKKQIAFRKQTKKLDLSVIKDLSEFRDIDKIDLLVQFFSHPELQSAMLQILFGSRTVNYVKNHASFVTRRVNHPQIDNKTKMSHKVRDGVELPKMDVKAKSLYHKHNLSMS